MSAGYVKHSQWQSLSYCLTGYDAASYPLKSLGGSTQLQCLPYRPTWNSNTASTPLGRTLLIATHCIFWLNQTFCFVVISAAAGHRGVFDTSLDNSLVLCAVCYTQSSPTVSSYTILLYYVSEINTDSAVESRHLLRRRKANSILGHSLAQFSKPSHQKLDCLYQWVALISW